MLAITRYRVPEGETAEFVTTAHRVLHLLAGSPGHRSGRLGRATDDPELWAMVTDWDGTGYYRRALSGYEVRLALMSLANRALDEPGVYEIVEV